MANDWVDVPEPKGTVTVEGADPVAFGTAAGVTALGGKGIWDTKKALWNKEGVNAYKPKSDGLQAYLNSQVHAPGVMSNVKLDQLSKISGMPTQTPAQVQAALAELGGAPAVPGTPSQRVPVTKMINGVPTITHYNTIPGTPEIPAKPHINLSDLARENYGPVQKQIAQLGFEKPAAAVMNVAKPLIQYAAKPLAIAGGAGEFQDAYNRYKNDDYVGAGISAVGGLGSLASMVPHPATRAIGTGVALGAPALNYAIDKFSKPKVTNADDGWKDAPEHAEGGSIDLPAMAGEIMRNHLEAKKPKPKPKHTIHTLPPGLTKEQFTHLCMGGHVEMAEGGQPPKSNANKGSAFVGYPQITNKPRDPNFKQQSGPILGAIDALIGAGPRSDISILNPQDLKYSESYDKFEPYGIAANVLPMVGGPMKAVGKAAARELGPTAANMAEDYLTKIGGIQHIVPPSKRNISSHPHGQDARVAQALEEYLKGNISQAERINILNQHLPIRQWTDLPPNYTDEQIKNALMANKQAKALAPVAAGARVGNRLDIPAYTQHGVYVDTTHDLAAGNSPISYNRTGHLKDVEFSSKPNQAVRVGLGTKEQALTPMGAEIGSAKSPFALIKGTNVGTSDDEVRRMMAEMMKDPNYTQIGMDPRKHSQFYDKSTGLPVFASEEKLQSGPLIIAPKKGLETTSWDDPRLNLTDFPGKQYKKGGKAKKK
jgi:hypothetical protein